MTLLFGSESWELKKAEHKLNEHFNAKALNWICVTNYTDSVFSTNLLPPLYYKDLTGSQGSQGCTVTSSTATIQLTLPTTMKSNLKDVSQEYYYRLPSTNRNAKIAGTELDLESIHYRSTLTFSIN